MVLFPVTTSDSTTANHSIFDILYRLSYLVLGGDRDLTFDRYM